MGSFVMKKVYAHFPQSWFDRVEGLFQLHLMRCGFTLQHKGKDIAFGFSTGLA
jgi:hypothetical protein